MPLPAPAPHRSVCARCGRPEVVCWCAHVAEVPTTTRVILLQHPRERRMPIGTARMAHLALPNSALRVGLDFSADPVVAPVVAAARAGTSHAYVLFPGPNATDLDTLPRAQDAPATLIVLDGTWSQARKLLRLNPALAQLPRVAFVPRRPSEYRIRQQPAALCVSTIEALAEVLARLEGTEEAGRIEALLVPFRAMVDAQLRFQSDLRTQRHRRPRRAASAQDTRRARLCGKLDGLLPRLVLVQGEANAWPRNTPAWQPPELVHWVAVRPATGERFERLIAPRRGLAPSTPRHVELAAERLLAGDPLEEARAAWARFLRPDDVSVSWGAFYVELAANEGFALPEAKLDLRTELSQMLNERVGTVEDAAALLGVTALTGGREGRAQRRIGALLDLVRALLRAGQPKHATSSVT